MLSGAYMYGQSGYTEHSGSVYVINRKKSCMKLSKNSVGFEEDAISA